MLTNLRNFFKPPIFAEEEDKTRKAKYAHVMALVLLSIALVFEIFVRSQTVSDLSSFELILIGFAFVCVTMLVLIL
jgi:hypothetical protein